MSDGFFHYKIDKLSITVFVISGDMSTKSFLVEVFCQAFFKKASNRVLGGSFLLVTFLGGKVT